MVGLVQDTSYCTPVVINPISEAAREPGKFSILKKVAAATVDVVRLLAHGVAWIVCMICLVVPHLQSKRWYGDMPCKEGRPSRCFALILHHL